MGEYTHLYMQTRDRLYSVRLDGDILSEALNVEIKFPEENVYPIGGALHKINGELWMIGGEKIIEGIRPPYIPFQHLVDRNHPYGTNGNCSTVFRIITEKRNGVKMELLPNKFMAVGKPNPISEVIGNKLYVLPGPSLFCRNPEELVKDMVFEEAYEVYDLESESWSTFPRLPYFTPYYHFLLSRKLYIYTGIQILSVYDTGYGRWSTDNGKLVESFFDLSHPFPNKGAYLKVDNNMHVLFGFHNDLPYAYLVSVADDVDSDEEVYMRCFQCLPGFFSPGLNDSNDIQEGVFVPRGDGKMCCICSHSLGSNIYNEKGFVICITVFSVTASKISSEKRRRRIFQSDYIAPIRCNFLDVVRISSDSYNVPEEDVDRFIRRATFF